MGKKAANRFVHTLTNEQAKHQTVNRGPLNRKKDNLQIQMIGSRK